LNQTRHLINGIILATIIQTVWAQTAGTGAITGTVTDPTGAVVQHVEIDIISETTGERRRSVTGTDGVYRFSLLPPGSYRLQASTSGFKVAVRSGLPVRVTETTGLDIKLELGSQEQIVSVVAAPELTQTDSNALGRVTDERSETNLPLVSRNFTQIIGLSPGVSVGLTDATELGTGSGGMTNLTNEALSVNGARSHDNNFQMDGAPSNDLFARTSQSGGIAIPNPDSIAQFKVQTGQYDASYGRNAGANVDVVTKSGTNEFHENLFEFFRNEDLNANNFFFNEAGVPRGILRQNQFGGTLGGPIVNDKLLFFGSYQGTRQLNGVTSGCSATFVGAPLTNDRSAAGLGAIFGGQTGAEGGVAVARNGSNINPVALTLLNLKLPNGTYVFPTPQQVVNGVGQYAFSTPCTYDSNQFITNIEYLQSAKSKLTAKFFFSNASSSQSLLYDNVPGSPISLSPDYRNLSLTHDYVFSPTILNQLEFGFHRIAVNTADKSAFTFPEIGSTVIPQSKDYAYIDLGQEAVGAYEITFQSSNAYTLQDTLTYNHGRHNLRIGGGFTRTDMTLNFIISSGLQFLSFPDLLLGESAAQNGSAYSNIYLSADLPGQLNRKWIVWNLPHIFRTISS
jgi:hypothetical protein